MEKHRKRYAHVGTGGRGTCFLQAMCKDWAQNCELVALCDSNPGHMEYYNRQIVAEFGGKALPAYTDRQFDRMIRTHKPDVVLVTTRDNFHDKYIVRAMELGCDVITEKPMTTDQNKCRRIIKAVERTGRNLCVTFNYRYSPPRTQVKDLLMKGAIGRVLSVELQWFLSTRHGADYFRRWHRQKRNSGGLLVHKATHHFDLVNWWLSACPEEVYAKGALRFYGETSAMVQKYQLEGRADRCLECKYQSSCHYSFWQKRRPEQDGFYIPNEHHDGYHRDQCVFGTGIDIEDTMSVMVRYNTGALLTYSLNAFSPHEGYRVAFSGTGGRLEHDCLESVYTNGDGTAPAETIPQGTRIRVYPHFQPVRDMQVKVVKGGHGGGDVLLMEDLFSERRPKDPYRRAAGVASGAMSVLTGIAANRSMRTGKTVRISSLVPDIPAPDYTPMPE